MCKIWKVTDNLEKGNYLEARGVSKTRAKQEQGREDDISLSIF